MMEKMKSMPGMGSMHEMMSKLGMPNLGKGGKMNMSGMESKMQQNLKMAQMKERMRKKAEEAKNNQKPTVPVSQASASASALSSKVLSDEQLISVFSKEEKGEKSLRGSKPVQVEQVSEVKSDSKQKKNKKK